MHSTAAAIVDEALIELPGCPRALVGVTLRDVVRELLDRSQVLTIDLTAINVVASTYLYTLTVPGTSAGYRINRPTLVVLNGIEQRPGIDYRMSSRTVLQLRDIPAAAITAGLEVTVALTLDDIQTADLTGLQDWYTPITAGVKSRLMLQAGKPWSEQQTGVLYRSEYHDGLSRAMSHAATDGLNAPMRMRM